jgi:hypothetical protein
MDAVKFFETAKRLCKDQGCVKCPACKDGVCMVMRMIRLDDNQGESIEETISKVEQWAKDHPIKTRQSEFLESFPNAYLGTITRLLPCELDKTLKPLRCAKYGYLSITCRCDRCRDDYWNEEVSE